jgi:hypothetical protein
MLPTAQAVGSRDNEKYSPGGAKEDGATIHRFLFPGRARSAEWDCGDFESSAVFLRPSEASDSWRHASHGLRRGLSSCAPSGLSIRDGRVPGACPGIIGMVHHVETAGTHYVTDRRRWGTQRDKGRTRRGPPRQVRSADMWFPNAAGCPAWIRYL